MKWFVCLTLTCLTQYISAQRLSLGYEIGGINYQGEMQRVSFSFTGMHMHTGFSAMYDLTERISVSGSLVHGNLSGRDRQMLRNGNNQSRNLSFNTRIDEFGMLLRVRLLADRPVMPYASAGAAVFNIDPMTVDAFGQTHALFPLSTEGQGLPEYPGQRPHRYTNAAIPWGGGLEVRIGRWFRVDLEALLRKTFTDDIDDVSSFYVDPAVLLKHRGPKAVELAYRGDEVPGGPSQYPPAGSQRGNRYRMDWYHSFNVRIRVVPHDWRRAREERRGLRQVDCMR
jgi:hypothetical protein